MHQEYTIRYQKLPMMLKIRVLLLVKIVYTNKNNKTHIIRRSAQYLKYNICYACDKYVFDRCQNIWPAKNTIPPTVHHRIYLK